MLFRLIRSSGLIPIVLLVLGTWVSRCSPEAHPRHSDASRWQVAPQHVSLQSRRWPAGWCGPRIRPFTVDVSGIEQPPAIDADMADVPGDSLVIGVRIGLATRAYLLKTFEARGVPLIVAQDGSAFVDPRDAPGLARHVINDVLGEQPVTIIYSGLPQSARVLTASARETALDVGLGGWDDGMLLLIDGRRIPQQSADLPLEDLPFEVTTWKQWRNRFPQTDIYVGG